MAGLVDLDGLVEQLDHVQNLDRIVSVLFSFELDKAVALMLVRDFVAWDVHIHDWSCLQKELPDNLFVDSRLQVAYIDCGLLISLKQGPSKTGKRGMFVHIARTCWRCC